MTGDWMQDAACKKMDPNTFFPEGKANRRPGEYSTGEARALLVCRSCPVRQPCLQWALSTHEQHGVFGGKIAAERRRLRPEVAA